MNSTAVRLMLANRNVLVTQLGLALFTLVLHGAWLATVVYSFELGGAAEAGVVALVVLVPAGLLSPFVAVWFDRYRPNIALAAGYGLQAAAFLVVAMTVSIAASKYVIYGLLALASIAQMASRPTISAVLPRVIVAPSQLSAANSATGVVETIGLVAGPALAGLVLYAADSVAVTFLVAGIAMAVAAASSTIIDTSGADAMRVDDDPDLQGALSKVVDGVRLLREQPGPRHIVVAMSTMRLVVGVLEVGVVVIAIEHLGRAEATAGLLGAAIGFGAIGGSALSFLLVGRRQLTGPIALGVVCASAPVALIAATTETWLVLGLLGLCGLGRPIVEVSGRTLLQGLSSDDMLARTFGMLEGLSLLVLAVGSGLFSALAVLGSLEVALVITGLLPCVVVASLFARLRQVDQHRPEVDASLLTLIRQIPIFAPLPAFRIEQMLLNMQRVEADAGTVIFSEGDEGDELFVVTDGSAVIELAEGQVLTPVGGFFGEIALMRDQPRMATVRAGEVGMAGYTLERDIFLDAIGTAHQSRARSARIIERRLGET